MRKPRWWKRYRAQREAGLDSLPDFPGPGKGACSRFYTEDLLEMTGGGSRARDVGTLVANALDLICPKK